MNINKIPLPKRVFSFCVVFASLSVPAAIAAPLEDISLSADADSVVATIRLSSPVGNVRYTPAKKGATLSILVDRLPSAAGAEEWLDNEVLKSPPSNSIPSFTVKTNLKNIQPRLIVEFSREAEYKVRMGRDGRSILIDIKRDIPLPDIEGGLPFLPEVKPLPAKTSDINKQAFELFQKGRNALAESDDFAAIDAFNKLLLLPPNDYTQGGQEWVGVSRERAGQLDKAKLEYDLYLKLYTQAEDVKRVKTRIATLGRKPVKPISVTAERTTQGKTGSQTLTYGSVSMHYYHGASKIDTVDNNTTLSGNAVNQTSFSNVDQSALITSVVATERFISEKYDNRIVFQDTHFANLLPGQTSKNRLGAAYLEVKNKESNYSVRMGRQSSSGGGVMGRFDGALAGVGITPSLRLNVVGGQLSDYAVGEKPIFYGASVDMGPVTVYAINQTVENVLDRQAVGTEIRYFEPNKTAFALFDYDTLFSALNVAMFQGTYSVTPERTFNLLIDHRRTPYLATRNALNGAQTSYLTDLMQNMPFPDPNLTEEEVRLLAADRTGTSNMVQVGVLQQLSAKWQMGADVRVSRFEAMPASGRATIDPNVPPDQPTITGLIPASEGSGNDWAFSPMLIGSNLYSDRDVTVLSFSYMSGLLYKGQSFYVYSRANLTDKWSLDGSLQYFKQNYESGIVMTRIMPTLRTAYQIRQTLSIDMDAGIEMSHSESDTQTSDVSRQFFSFGFRWDF